MRSLAFASVLLLLGCGAKTGLKIPDAGDAPDAGMDAGYDSGVDAAACFPEPVALERRGAQVMFVVDRSNSMNDTLDGQDPIPGEPTRWNILGDTLTDVLEDRDPLLEIGAKFYPSVFGPIPGDMPMQACVVDMGIDVPPARGRLGRIRDLFNSTSPAGGTPTAAALNEVARFYASRPAPGVPRFVVLATDGGPNCSPDPPEDHTTCLCTGGPMDCLDDVFGPLNCIDDVRTIEVIRRLNEDLEIPVYVIGIDDPTRPDLADVLDQMAIAGGRPLGEEEATRRFYSVGERDELEGALTTIADTIARCVFELSPVPPPAARVEVAVDGLIIPRDGTRSEGWDFTAPDASEITIFGGACERVTATDGDVTAEILCDEE